MKKLNSQANLKQKQSFCVSKGNPRFPYLKPKAYLKKNKVFHI